VKNTEGQARRRWFSKRLKLTAGALACSLVALTFAALLFSSQARLVRTSAAQANFSGWTAQLESILVYLVDASSAERAFLLTGDERHLAPLSAARRQLPGLLARLPAIGTTFPQLAPSLQRIQRQASARWADLEEIARLATSGQHALAVQQVRAELADGHEEELRTEINAAVEVIRSDRRQTRARLLAGSIDTQYLAQATIGALVLCVLLAALQIGSLISGQRRYELTLAASEQRHRAIVDEQTEFISLSRPDGTLTYVNPAYARFFQVPHNALKGHSLYDWVVETDGDLMRGRIAAVLDGAESALLETRVNAGGQQKKWIAWRHRMQLDADGVALIHSVGRDITKRKDLEERLEANERFMRDITDSVPVRLAYFDCEQRFQFVNRALCERFGNTREDFLGRSLAGISSEAARSPVAERLVPAIAGKAQRFEYDDETADGTRRIETHLLPDLGPAGEVRGVFAVGVDITHLKSVERALRDLTEVFDNTPDFIAQTNWRGEVQYLNPSARHAVGLSPNAPLAGRSFTEFYTPATNRRWLDEIVPAVKRAGAWLGETAVMLQGQRAVPVSHMVIAHRDVHGRVARYSSVMRDISNEVLARRALARQTATLNSVIEAIPAMIAVWDTELRCRLVNRAFERWRGGSRTEFVGHTIKETLGNVDYERTLPYMNRALGGETVAYETEYVAGAESHHVSVTYTPLSLEDGSIGGFVGIAQDITRHREENIRLLLLAEHDPLTGALNRGGFESYLGKKMQQGDGAALAVLYIDLDNFKPINDTYGHATGDEVLREFASRLQCLVRPTDAVARLGGDEFAVALAGVRGPDSAAVVADKIVEMARQPIMAGERRLNIGASVGVACNAEAAGGWKGLVARADAMVYRAKALGRGRREVAPEHPQPDTAGEVQAG
jgi:diguanylate cyclase (GGDEF)-like protein/PAS domain S-box-containing protein